MPMCTSTAPLASRRYTSCWPNRLFVLVPLNRSVFAFAWAQHRAPCCQVGPHQYLLNSQTGWMYTIQTTPFAPLVTVWNPPRELSLWERLGRTYGSLWFRPTAERIQSWKETKLEGNGLCQWWRSFIRSLLLYSSTPPDYVFVDRVRMFGEIESTI